MTASRSAMWQVGTMRGKDAAHSMAHCAPSSPSRVRAGCRVCSTHDRPMMHADPAKAAKRAQERIRARSLRRRRDMIAGSVTTKAETKQDKWSCLFQQNAILRHRAHKNTHFTGCRRNAS